MRKLVAIARDPNIKVQSDCTEFLMPTFVYLPIFQDDKILVRNKKVKKGQLLFQHHEKEIFSPISGEIEKIVTLGDCLYLLIKNDYQENDNFKGLSETTTIITTNLSSRLKKSELLKDKMKRKAEVILLNGIEDEPYAATKIFLHRMYTDEILLVCDAFSEVAKIPKIFLCLKENDRESIEAFQQKIYAYPNIEIQIVPDFYPIGNPLLLAKYLKLEDKAIVFDTEEIYDAYYEIAKERKQDFLFITFTGNALSNPQVIKVKKGTRLEEVYPLFKFKMKNYAVFINHLMNGKERNPSYLILNEEVKVVYFMKKNVVQVQKCIQCGKCNFVCPVKCNPYKSYLTNGKFTEEKCLHCGLCTFICPSYIPLELYLGGGKNEN